MKNIRETYPGYCKQRRFKDGGTATTNIHHWHVIANHWWSPAFFV